MNNEKMNNQATPYTYSAIAIHTFHYSSFIFHYSLFIYYLFLYISACWRISSMSSK